jgi:hypothetical protein
MDETTGIDETTEPSPDPQRPEQKPRPGGTAPGGTGSRGKSSRGMRPRVRLGAIVALAAGAAFVVWLVAVHKNGSGSASTTTTTTTTTTVQAQPPIALTQQALAAFATALKQPIYWAGPKPGYTHELTRTTNGSVYVRYLPPGVKAADPRATFLIIATYPDANALPALEAVAKGQGFAVPGGGFAYVAPSYPQSVHIAYPNVPFQVEVYDADPAVALKVAKSGTVTPVG